MELPGVLISPLLWCNATGFFFGFTRNWENRGKAKKKVVLPPAAKSKQALFFLFQAVTGFFFFQSWRILYKN